MANQAELGTGGAAPAPDPSSGGFGAALAGAAAPLTGLVTGAQGDGGYSPDTQSPLYGPSGTGSGGSGAGAPSAQQLLQDQLSWTNAIAEHYLGRDLSYRELLEVQKRGWNPNQLSEHIRAQGSYIPGLTIGQVEDYHSNAKQPFMDWLGREPTDEDIRDLHNRGFVDQQAIDEYVRNRDDVMALHPGAPLNMKDLEYGVAKNSIDNSYLQNLGRTANDDEARRGITDRTRGPKPVMDEELKPEYSQGETGLASKNMIAPNARSFA